MGRLARRARYYVVTDRGDTDYFDTEEDMAAMLEIWRSKGRKEFYVFKRERLK